MNSMLFYEVKLINPETKEVYFTVTATKPTFPSKKIMDANRNAILVIRTNPPEVESVHDHRGRSGKSR